MTYIPAFSRDPRDVPTYGIAQAAHYLGLSATTLRQWVLGRPYPTQEGGDFSEPLIKLPAPDRPWLSFTNLVEAYVLAALRREHRIQMLRPYLRRIEHDATGLAERLFPLRRTAGADSPRVVVIDPYISFGKPTVAGTGVSVAILIDRFRSGEALTELADDYDMTMQQVEEAVRYGLPDELAA